MIPRKIHYVWLGNGPKPTSVQDCINSWKEKMPNYEIKCWNENNFDIQSVTWVKEAIQMKKWSLASDYIRHYALFTEGGIYMDTDVKVFKSFDPFLHWDFFSSVEYHPEIFQEKGIKQINVKGEALNEGDTIAGIGILAACIAAQKGNPFIKECLDFFGNRHFIKEDGSLFTDIINPGIMATIATQYGFRYIDKDQLLDNNMMIYNSSVFAGNPATRNKESYSMHYCDGSWREKTTYQTLKSFVRSWIKKHH
jgi:hypothetical protein